MLLTLSANSLRSRLVAKKGRADAGSDRLALTDLPRFVRNELGLYGLNLSTNLLAGADAARIDAIRDAADKAPCPCLVLVESEVQPMGTTDDAVGDAAIARLQRVVQAASRLGCNSVGVSISGEESEDAYDFTIERLRRVLQVAERLEVNILLAPAPGPTADPDKLTELIKKVGGFRIGTFPDYQAASRSSDPLSYLRRLTPYASAVTAAVVGFKPRKGPGPAQHEPYDLIEYTRVVQSVGYTGTLALDYRGEAADAIETIRLAKAALESVVQPQAATVPDLEALLEGDDDADPDAPADPDADPDE
jgi:sugar phosphate isomerase/epimerase